MNWRPTNERTESTIYDDTYAEYYNTGKHDLAQIYLKSEADKVIAEKDADIQRLEKLCESYRIDCDNLAISNEQAKRAARTLLKKMNHNKYKRCLAMAQVLEHVCSMTNRKAKWRDKWHKRWLEIAEQFKPNN